VRVPPRIRASRVPELPQPSRPGTKGRPTPKRREAEAARRRPLVAGRKDSAREQRARDKAARDREYQALVNNDERNLPPRDKGPVPRWVRDYVDARRNPGEYFLPVAITVVLITFVAKASQIVLVVGFLYLVVIAAVVDALLLNRRIKRLVTAKFGAEKVPRRIGIYGVLRAFQMRRSRLPKPQVKRGEYPH
jgi:hypothetical protein